MKALASFFLSRDGIVAVATLILLGVVSHFSDPYNPWINLLARVGNVCVFLYILWRAAGKAIVDGLSNRRAAMSTNSTASPSARPPRKSSSPP